MLAALVSPGRVILPDNDMPVVATDRFILLDGVVERGQCVLRAANECDGGPVRVAFLTQGSTPKNIYACNKHRTILERALAMDINITVGKGEADGR